MANARNMAVLPTDEQLLIYAEMTLSEMAFNATFSTEQPNLFSLDRLLKRKSATDNKCKISAVEQNYCDEMKAWLPVAKQVNELSAAVVEKWYRKQDPEFQKSFGSVKFEQAQKLKLNRDLSIICTIDNKTYTIVAKTQKQYEEALKAISIIRYRWRVFDNIISHTDLDTQTGEPSLLTLTRHADQLRLFEKSLPNEVKFLRQQLTSLCME